MNEKKTPRRLAEVPFRLKSSLMAKVFLLACHGTTIKELDKLCTLNHTKSARLLRILRRGRYYQVTWKVEESNGRIKVIYP